MQMATQSTITNPAKNTFLSIIPNDLRNVLKLRTHWTNNVGTGNTENMITSVVDAVSLLGYIELTGRKNSYLINDYEEKYQTQMAYYAMGNSKDKWDHTTTVTHNNWWTSSPYVRSANEYVYEHIYNEFTAALIDGHDGAGAAPVFIV